MNMIEKRLELAAEVAGQRRSVAEDVLRTIQQKVRPIRRSRWRLPVATLAAASGIAAVVAIVVMLMGTGASLTLAQVQAAFEREAWVHTKYDAGQWKEWWTNLQTGEHYVVHADGSVSYMNPQTNTMLRYSKGIDLLYQSQLQGDAKPWSPQTAWENVVGPYEQGIARQKEKGGEMYLIKEDDILDGKKVVRFDWYSEDALGKRFLGDQLWVDPATRLPVRKKMRMQLADREEWGKEWSTGVYAFPQTGPTDIYALGVPKGTPIRKKEATTTPDEVKPILEAIDRNNDGFLKNYRAVVVKEQENGWVDFVAVMWRDGEKIRCDYYLPGLSEKGMRTDPRKLSGLTTAELLAWAEKCEPAHKDLMDKEHAYSWRAGGEHDKKPQVHVYRHHRTSLQATVNLWPESVQWLWRRYGPGFELLEVGPETPEGCVGLRHEGLNFLRHYYFDPRNDYVCVKQIHWTKREAEWAKEHEYTLEDLQRVEGHVVAGRQREHYYGQPGKYQAYTKIQRMELVPMLPEDYPTGIFDPKSLTDGAVVEAY
ncbi:MAG: hypothetical protein FWD53_07960 [Phycisphaerales bacterium]|nr:hypothetical protein [Phycisphaerales bacterium]